MRTLTLPRVPSLADSYARALARAGRDALRRDDPAGAEGGAGTADVAYAAHGLRPDPERLAAYQHLVGEPATDELPAGYVHVIAFPVAMAAMVRPEFPLPVVGLVHVANHVEQFQPVFAGEDLDVRAYARDLRPHRRGTQVDVVAEVALPRSPTAAARGRSESLPAVGGRSGSRVLLWRGVSTYLAKGVHLPNAGAGDAPDAGPPAAEPFSPPTATARWDLGRDVGRRYAAVSGDRNPIHLSALTARAFGFRSAIAHGMYTAARALALVGRARGDAFTWDVTFDAPVLLPGRVDVRVAPRGDGHDVVGWDPRSGRRHLAVGVTPR